MGRVNDFIKYTCRGYRYAPESFRAFKVFMNRYGDGRHEYIELELSDYQRALIGNAYICGGKDPAISLAKRFDRDMMRRQQRVVTYGFLDVHNPKEYYFTRQLYCRPDAPIKERYSVFKRFKNYLMKGNTYSVSECQFDGRFNPVGKKTRTNHDHYNVDLSKPVRVYLKTAG